MPQTDPTHPQPQFVDVFEARWVGRALRRHGVKVVPISDEGHWLAVRGYIKRHEREAAAVVSSR